ncbi:Uncharacterized protein HZ326_24401 [Fusarium oxysporum f. sp. albedinis]|nr:Uncharacterized protein HZ326_24401 [Fusarium oxysporum f. sp. albedinis]
MRMIIPSAAALGRHFVGPSFLMWPLSTAILLNYTGRSQIGRDIRLKGSGESAFTTPYSTHIMKNLLGNLLIYCFLL